MNLTPEQKQILNILLNLASGSHGLVNPDDEVFEKMAVQQMRQLDPAQLYLLQQELNNSV